MQIVDLFAGIGGFSLAGTWMGWDTVQMVEIDPWCQSILKKNFPNSPIHPDIKTFGIEELKKTRWDNTKETIICGGFPCQPFSSAGKQRGTSDDRYLFPETLRTIQEIKPKWVVLENVSGIIKLSLDKILTHLEDKGYDTRTYVIPASAVGALHNRNRVWIIGLNQNSFDTYTNGIRSYRKEMYVSKKHVELQHEQIRFPGSFLPKSIRKGTDPRIFRNANGISHRVDRIRALGNAIVPQVAYAIFNAIENYEYSTLSLAA